MLARPPAKPNKGGRRVARGKKPIRLGVPVIVNRNVVARKTVNRGGPNINNMGMSLNGKTPFPQKYLCSQAYGDSYVLTAGVFNAFGTEQTFAINNMFDPDFTGVGHQPYGRDTLNTIYGKYLVKAVTCHVNFSDPTSDGLLVGCKIDNDTDAGSAIQGLNYTSAQEKPNIWTCAINNTGSQKASFSRTFQLNKLMGVSKQQYNSQLDVYGASGPAASPTRRFFFRIAVLDQRNVAALNTIIANVRLVMHVQWYDRLTLPTS